ncbi:hypothetical protein VI817_008803 [Penicillium citrinum]|nr:hypothetical protein VI817_008803 [Penicillium citrinum]
MDRFKSDCRSIRHQRIPEQSNFQHGITERILYEHNVDTVRWSGAENMWYINAIHLGEPKVFKSRFIVFGTGYYDYQEPLRTEIPGLDYTDKRVVVIGSGATAITVVPNSQKTPAK